MLVGFEHECDVIISFHSTGVTCRSVSIHTVSYYWLFGTVISIGFIVGFVGVDQRSCSLLLHIHCGVRNFIYVYQSQETKSGKGIC